MTTQELRGLVEKLIDIIALLQKDRDKYKRLADENRPLPATNPMYRKD